MVEKIRILIGRDLDDVLIQRILSVDPRIEIDISHDSEERDRKIRDADILFTHRPRIDVGQAPRLKWIHFMWEGVDHILADGYNYPGIILTNSSGSHSIPIAEYVFTCILEFTKRFDLYRDHQRRSQWLDSWDQPRVGSLNGKTIGIVGYGRIGRAVSKIARGFGMRVLAMKRDPAMRSNDKFDTPGCCDMEGKIPEVIYGPEDIVDLLSYSDFVVLSLPLTAETEYIIGEDQLRCMRSTSFLVNIGRGKLVDENMLIRALEDGWIAGAALDVFEEEPLPSDSVLWGMENVIVTPHSSTGGDWADEAVCDLFVHNLKRYLEGSELINVVDQKRGY